jgi:hypothetical protein
MCLPAREQRQLDGIGDAVRRQDAKLASMMVAFGRLAASEPMPEREQIVRTSGPVRAALEAADAAVARLAAWLDRVDSPRTGQERLGRDHRHVR